MNDLRNGLVQGLSIGLFIAEKNRKNPKRIEADLLKILRELVFDLGHDGIDQIELQVRLDRRPT